MKSCELALVPAHAARVGLAAALAVALVAGPTWSVDLLVGDRIGSVDKIWRFDATSGAYINDFTTKAASGLDGPRGIALGPDGRIYVSSYTTDEIIRYDAVTGAKIDVFVTAGSGGLDGPQGLAFGPEDGNLYVSSRNTNSVKRYQGPGGASPGAYIDDFVVPGAGAAALVQPAGLIFGKDCWPPPCNDGHRDLLVCSYGTGELKMYSGVDGSFIRNWFASGPTAYSGPIDLSNPTDVILDAGPLQGAAYYVSCVATGNNCVYRLSGDEPQSWFVVYASGNGLNQPYGLAWSPDVSGDHVPELLVASYADDSVKRFRGPGNGAGQFIDAIVPSGNQGLDGPGPILVSCGGQFPPVLETVQNDRGLVGTTHTIGITGQNLASITAVKLIKSRFCAAEIASTSVQMVGDVLNATFDIPATAEAGRYDVVPVDPCGMGNTLREGFLIYLPALTNGSFEEGCRPDPTPNPVCEDPGRHGNRPTARHWDEGERSWVSQGEAAIRDGNVWVVCDGVTGQHYAGMQDNAGNDGRLSMFQTIAAPYADVNGITSQEYAVYADCGVFSPLRGSFGLIRLLDGTETDYTVITETYVFNTQDLGPGLISDPTYFSAFVPAGYQYRHPERPLLTIEFTHVLVAGDVCEYPENPDCPFDHALKAFWIDNVRNEPVVMPCHTPPQDSDGDNDVDVNDFGVFQICFNGPGNPWPTFPGSDEKCPCMDDDGDGDVDVNDFAVFQTCFNGPGNAPACPQ